MDLRYFVRRAFSLGTMLLVSGMAMGADIEWDPNTTYIIPADDNIYYLDNGTGSSGKLTLTADLTINGTLELRNTDNTGNAILENSDTITVNDGGVLALKGSPANIGDFLAFFIVFDIKSGGKLVLKSNGTFDLKGGNGGDTNAGNGLTGKSVRVALSGELLAESGSFFNMQSGDAGSTDEVNNNGGNGGFVWVDVTGKITAMIYY